MILLFLLCKWLRTTLGPRESQIAVASDCAIDDNAILDGHIKDGCNGTSEDDVTVDFLLNDVSI